MSPNGVTRPQWVNSSPPAQNGRHFTDHISKCIFINEMFCILIQIPLNWTNVDPVHWLCGRWVQIHLTHWGWVTHICVSKLISICSDNGLSPSRRQAIFWTNTGILLIGPWGTNFSEILIKIHTFSLKDIHLKMSSGKLLSFCLGLNMLTRQTMYRFSTMHTSWHL